MKEEIAGIRKEYKLKALEETEVAADPFTQFGIWWKDATNSDIDEVNAMTLATADADGTPAARIVLLKDYDQRGFVFFTNYNSNKGRQIDANPKATLLFFWKELERQVRITGKIEKVETSESDEYFNSRPAGSKVGAWASPQSAVIESRDVLDENVKKYSQQFGTNVPRPKHWGGYRVVPAKIEFWQGRPSRLHDRILYTKNGDNWKIERLAP